MPNHLLSRPDAIVAGDSLPAQVLLAVRGLTVRFGSIVALEDVSFEVMPGSITGLIGPNGAGKTTLFNCLSRLYAWDDGQIEFAGQPLGSVPPHGIAGLGIGRTFQNLALFESMNVLDNIKVGAHCRSRAGFAGSMLGLSGVSREEADIARAAWALVDFLELGDVAFHLAGELPFGTRKRVELARALLGEPRLLLLDEPAAGLNQEEVQILGDLIVRIRDELKITVFLVEHHMGLVMRVSDRVVALNFGRMLYAGTPAEVQQHPEVIRAYLG